MSTKWVFSDFRLLQLKQADMEEVASWPLSDEQVHKAIGILEEQIGSGKSGAFDTASQYLFELAYEAAKGHFENGMLPPDADFSFEICWLQEDTNSALTIEEIAKVFPLSFDMHEKTWVDGKTPAGSGHYSKDQYQCFEAVCKDLCIDPRFVRFFDLASHWGNDILDWCEEVTNGVRSTPGSDNDHSEVADQVDKGPGDTSPQL